MSFLYDDKSKLVNKVFNHVYDNYDLMNDIMSLGSHRIWKKNLISWIAPKKYNKIIDVASGTGDIAKLFYKRTNSTGKITCVEPNKKMLEQGKIKLKKFRTINNDLLLCCHSFLQQQLVKLLTYNQYLRRRLRTLKR